MTLYTFLGWFALLCIFGTICLCARVIAVWFVSVINKNKDQP